MSGSPDYTTTPNLGLYKPIRNMAVGTWGDLWNSNADALDSAIHFATGGGPFLPLAGGTVTGPTVFNTTDAVRLPSGTTAQRPVSALGHLRFNTTNAQLEVASANAATPLPVATRIARMGNTGGIRSWDTTGLSSSTAVIAALDAYSGATGNWGAAWLDWNAASMLSDDSVTVLTPTAIGAGNPGRWIKRLPGGVLDVEHAGAVADYVFPTNGVGENIGTDNTAALTNACYSVAYSAVLHKGGTAQMRAGIYRVAGVLNMPPGSRLRGAQGLPYALIASLRFTSGSVIVLDGPNATIQLGQGAVLENVRVMRRGIDLAPTPAVTNAYWTARLNDVCAGRQWQPVTVYSQGDVVVNYNQVYVCDTGGTSGAQTSGGPRSQRIAANALIDGSCAWHWINAYTWYRSKPVQVGALMCSTTGGSSNVYQCDTAGTTSSSGQGPTATTATVNSIVDGTARWHWIGAFGTAVTAVDYASLENVAIVGFAKGVASLTGLNMRNVWVDAIHCVDICNSGDIAIMERVLCRAQYFAAGDVRRRHGYGIYLHDRVDLIVMRVCGAQLWAIGICLANVWPMMQDCGVETDVTTNGDTCIQLLGIITGGLFSHNYVNGVIGWDIAATDLAHDPDPVAGWTTATSALEIVGGWFATLPASSGVGAGMWPNTIFQIAGQARGMIRGCTINQQGQAVMQLPPTNYSSGYFWNVKDLDVIGVNAMVFTDFANIDPSVASLVHFSNIWHADFNEPLVQSDHNDTLDLVTAPTSGATRIIPNGRLMCRLNGAATLASYTVTMPSAPLDGQRQVISTKSAITAFSLGGNAGQTVEAPPTALIAGQCLRYRFIGSLATWVAT